MPQDGIRNPFIDIEPFLAEELKVTKIHYENPETVRTLDSEIYEKVCEAIYNLHDVDASGLIITVKDGEVTLSGNVPALNMKWAVETPIADIGGVWKIYNNIQVKEEDSPLNITNH